MWFGESRIGSVRRRKECEKVCLWRPLSAKGPEVAPFYCGYVVPHLLGIRVVQEKENHPKYSTP